MTQRVDSFLQIGPHQSASDTTLVTGTTRFLRTKDKPQFHGAKPVRIPRPYQTGDGSKLADLEGMKDLSTLPSLNFNLLGLSGGGAGNLVAASSLDTDLDELLRLAFGDDSAAESTTGDTTHAVDAGTGATLTLDGSVTAGSFKAWLVQGTTSPKYRPRFQTSASGADVTMCRALTTDAGAADTPNEGATAFGGLAYLVRTNAPNRVPVFIDVEGGAQRDVYRGVHIARTTFSFAAGDVLGVSFDIVHSASDLAQTLQAPTYAAPTQGSEIKVWDSPAWIGSTQVMPKGGTIVVENILTLRGSEGGEDGNYGYVVEDVNVTVDMNIGYGALTLEQARSFVTTLQGPATQDLLLSAGRTPGAAAAARIPEFDCTAEIVANGGKHEIKLTGKGIGTTPMQLAIF